MKNVIVNYDARSKYWKLIRDWLNDRDIVFRETSLMDCSPVGMSFLYSFEQYEDAIAFRIRFGEFCS